jgi:hypothetical protein
LTYCQVPQLFCHLCFAFISSCIVICFCFFGFCFGGSSGVWAQGLALARQVPYHLSHVIIPFCFGCFWDRVSHLCLGIMDHSSVDRSVPLHPAFIGWHGASQTFCLGWPWTAVLLISASQVARVIGLSHHAWPQIHFSVAELLFVSLVYSISLLKFPIISFIMNNFYSLSLVTAVSWKSLPAYSI